MIRRSDFRAVKPTPEEEDRFRAQPRNRGRHGLPYRAEHIPCGTRIWYSGIAIGSHMRACPGHR
jgi:hypothetical protein